MDVRDTTTLRPRAAVAAVRHVARVRRGSGGVDELRRAAARLRLHAGRAPRGSRVRRRAARELTWLRAHLTGPNRAESPRRAGRRATLAGLRAERWLARAAARAERLERARDGLSQEVGARARRALHALAHDLPIGLSPRWAASIEQALRVRAERVDALCTRCGTRFTEPRPGSGARGLRELAGCLDALAHERELARRFASLAAQVRGCRRARVDGLRARALVRAVRALLAAGADPDDPRLLTCLQHHVGLLGAHADLTCIAARLPTPRPRARDERRGPRGIATDHLPAPLRNALGELRWRTRGRRVLVLAPGPNLPLRGQLEAWLAPRELFWHASESGHPLARLARGELLRADLILDLHGAGADHRLALAGHLDPARQLFAAPERTSDATGLLVSLLDELAPLRPAA